MCMCYIFIGSLTFIHMRLDSQGFKQEPEGEVSLKNRLCLLKCEQDFFFLSSHRSQQAILHALPAFLVLSARLTTSDKNVSDQKKKKKEKLRKLIQCSLIMSCICVSHLKILVVFRCVFGIIPMFILHAAADSAFKTIIIRQPCCAPPNQAQSRPHHHFNTILRRIQFSLVSVITEPLRQSLYYTGDTSELSQP